MELVWLVFRYRIVLFLLGELVRDGQTQAKVQYRSRIFAYHAVSLISKLLDSTLAFIATVQIMTIKANQPDIKQC